MRTRVTDLTHRTRNCMPVAASSFFNRLVDVATFYSRPRFTQSSFERRENLNSVQRKPHASTSDSVDEFPATVSSATVKAMTSWGTLACQLCDQLPWIHINCGCRQWILFRIQRVRRSAEDRLLTSDFCGRSAFIVLSGY